MRVTTLVTASLALAMMTGPAFAGVVRVPEPASISLIAAAIGGALIAKTFRRK